MNYFTARQRKDGRWDFTCGNDGHVYPVGYCCERHIWNEEDEKRFGIDAESMNSKTDPFKEKYHTDGHATPEEAAECYLEYQLDQHMHIRNSSSSQHKCAICDEWTQGIVTIGESRMLTLCEKHQTKDDIRKIVKPSTQIWSS